MYDSIICFLRCLGLIKKHGVNAIRHFRSTRRIEGSTIRAILKQGRIEPIDELPRQLHEGHALTVEGGDPSDDPAEIRKWHKKRIALSSQISSSDHERLAAALAEQDLHAKEMMRREMGMNR